MDDVYGNNSPREFQNPQALHQFDEKKAIRPEEMMFPELK